jgi:hypothetical protein
VLAHLANEMNERERSEKNARAARGRVLSYRTAPAESVAPRTSDAGRADPSTT